MQRAYDNFPFSDDFSSLDVPKDDFILWTSRLDADHQAIKYVLNERRKKNSNTKKFLSGLSIDSLKTKKMDIFGVRDCEDEKRKKKTKNFLFDFNYEAENAFHLIRKVQETIE